jgi:hypothetical protein
MISVLVQRIIFKGPFFIAIKPFSWGAIQSELSFIAYAKKSFEITPSYLALCKNYFACYSMPVVAWSVNQHQNKFHQNYEWIKNNTLFVGSSIKNCIERGTSLEEEKFAFTSLDWRYHCCRARDLYTANAKCCKMGIGPIQATKTHHILDDFLQWKSLLKRCWGSCMKGLSGESTS